jgi:CrcB protein
MMTYLWIGIGSAIGGIFRYALSSTLLQRYGVSLPWGIMAVNISGSFLIGFCADIPSLSIPFRQFLLIGIFGGYTTFSSFSLETLNLARDREWAHAGANVLLSVFFCLIAVWLGHLASQSINSRS